MNDPATLNKQLQRLKRQLQDVTDEYGFLEAANGRQQEYLLQTHQLLQGVSQALLGLAKGVQTNTLEAVAPKIQQSVAELGSSIQPLAFPEVNELADAINAIRATWHSNLSNFRLEAPPAPAQWHAPQTPSQKQFQAAAQFQPSPGPIAQ